MKAIRSLFRNTEAIFQRRISRVIIPVAIFALSIGGPLQHNALAQDADGEPEDMPAETFLHNCLSCHAGLLTGTDLANVGQSTTESLDATTRRMQQHTGPLTEKQIADLVSLMKDKDIKFRVEEAKLTDDELGDIASATGDSAAPIANDVAAKHFLKDCMACHAGVLTGSDLVNLSTRSVPYLDAAVRRMEKNVGPMTDDQIKALVELVHDPHLKQRLLDAEDAPDGASPVVADASTTPEASKAAADGSTMTEKWTVGGNTGSTATALSEDKTTAVAGEAAAGDTDTAALLFNQTCAACHTVGGGAALTGPDLAHVSSWSDPDLSVAVKRMETHVGPLTDVQVKSLVDLLKESDVKDRLKAAEEQKVQAQSSTMDKASTTTGEQLYNGEIAFANGGSACAACHVFNGQGGTMGPSLNGIYERLGETALKSAATGANFKVMKAAYRDHKVTEQEAIHLAAYLGSVKPGESTKGGSLPGVPLMSLIGTAALLGGLGYLQRNRRNRSIRAKLARRR